MSDVRDPDDARLAERATLNPEEQAAGSDDPEVQAAAILADADERTRARREDEGVEQRTSEDTVDPSDQ